MSEPPFFWTQPRYVPLTAAAMERTKQKIETMFRDAPPPRIMVSPERADQILKSIESHMNRVRRFDEYLEFYWRQA